MKRGTKNEKWVEDCLYSPWPKVEGSTGFKCEVAYIQPVSTSGHPYYLGRQSRECTKSSGESFSRTVNGRLPWGRPESLLGVYEAVLDAVFDG